MDTPFFHQPLDALSGAMERRLQQIEKAVQPHCREGTFDAGAQVHLKEPCSAVHGGWYRGCATLNNRSGKFL